jgi:hypothetical protein
VLVNGKTGSRHIPLIDSIPYVKDYLDHEHPQPGNSNAILFSGKGKGFGRAFGVIYLYTIYNDYKKNFFPNLLQDPNSTRGQAEDKGVVEKALESIRKTTL